VSRFPRPRGRELIAALKHIGFVVVRVRGSHHQLRHPDGRATTIPVNAGDEIGEKLLKAVLRQCNLSVEELRKIL